MLFASLCLVGVTSVFLYRFDIIMKEGNHGNTNLYSYFATIILTQTLTALIVGLLSYFTRNSINEYILAIVGALFAIVGILMYIASSQGANLTFFGTILISIGSGMGWVMFPLIAYDDAGPQPFGVLLSLIFLANYWGMCTFGFIFFLVTENVVKPMMSIYTIYIIGLIGSMVGSAVSLIMDDERLKRHY